MFQFTDDLREELFIQISKYYFEKDLWGPLPQASKAVLPIILKHLNEDGTCFPSQQTIAILAGITEKTVRHGLKGLDGLPGYETEKYISRRGHIAYKYRMRAIPEHPKSISICHGFFNGGNWSQLTPSAKAVYPVLKYFAWWDFGIYREDEEIIEHEGEDLSGQNYPHRSYDYADPDRECVSSISGIATRSVGSAYDSLIDCHFIELHEPSMGRETWKLFVDPQMVFKPDYLNRQARERYAVENFTH